MSKTEGVGGFCNYQGLCIYFECLLACKVFFSSFMLKIR